MLGYHESVVAALQSQRNQSAGYQVSPEVTLEITLESVAQEFTEQRRLNNEASKSPSASDGVSGALRGWRRLFLRKCHPQRIRAFAE